MDMATKDEIAFLRMLFSPFNSSIEAVRLDRIKHTYDLFAGSDIRIVHPKLIYEYLSELKPLSRVGFESIKELMTANSSV